MNDVGVAVVLNDVYSSHRYLRLPWMSAGATEEFSMAWELPQGQHRITVLVDPEARVIEAEERRANNQTTVFVQVD